MEVDEDGGGTNYNSVDGSTRVDDNKWHHLVFTRVGRTLYLYADGVLGVAPSVGDGTANISNAASLSMGGNNPCGDVATYLDDVRIYNRALSATEIKQLYTLGTANVAHSNTIISNGLVGYWTFDGGSIDWHTNPVADMSGNGNTGSLISMSTTSSPVPGKIGQALKFNGGSGYVDTADNPFDFGTGSFTVGAWIKATSFDSSYHGIISKRTDANYTGWDIFLFPSDGTFYANKLGFEIADQHLGPYYDTWTDMPISTDTWYHVVEVVNRTTNNTTLYLNGVSATTTVNIASLGNVNNAQNVQIAKETGISNWNGAIDDVRIYNRALSATEIKQLYNAGR